MRRKLKKKSSELDLFPQTPETRFRDTKGRFATPERAYVDKAIRENQYLRLECERYKRAYMSATKTSNIWQRKYFELRQKVKELCM